MGIKRKRIKRKKKNSYSAYLKELLLASICGLGLVIFFSLFFFSWLQVAGYSMRPALYDQDIIIVKKTKVLQRFDLVAFTIGTKQQIRRVIGLPGETIQYQKDTLFVNSKPVDEKFLVDEVNESQHNGRNYTEDFINGDQKRIQKIPDGYYLVLGDNRPHATDSRHYGLIAEKNIIGRIGLRVFPINDFQQF